MRLSVAAVTLAVCVCSLSVDVGYAQTTPEQAAPSDDRSISVLADRLAKDLLTRKSGKVTVLDFIDTQDRANELGRYLADKLSAELFDHDGLTILDRANLASLMREHQLTAEGLVENPEDAKKLGQLRGVKAILVGTLTSINGKIELLVKGISTDTAEWVAKGETSFEATPDLLKMLGQGAGRLPGAAANEGAAITKAEVGPLMIVLRNVAEVTVARGGRDIPAIQCRFDLENRNLGRWVAVAANQKVKEVSGYRADTAGYRGGLVDSNQAAWSLVEVNGTSGVAGFEFSQQTITQSNPGGIVDYIRSAKKSDGQAQHFDGGRFWLGSLESIAPGKTTSVTVNFIPANVREEHDAKGPFLQPRSRREPEKAEPWKHPEFFALNMELVTGTYAEGEEALKSKDLALRQLSIDRVTLPARVKGAEAQR